MNSCVIGLQYGDEGKGKVVDSLVDSYRGCVRFSGGSNAGHTVYKDGRKYVLHQLPSGIVRGKPVYLEPGMVLDVDRLKKEMEEFDSSLVNINKRVHVITPEHRHADSAGSGIGSTKRGVGPCYASRASRRGLRIENTIPEIELNIYDMMDFDRGYLFEGAQGIMLDIDYGHYPYVTSSSILPSIRYNINRVVGVMKPYVSRVGVGPPNRQEIPILQIAGNEYGATTGRPRRCYWLDLDELAYAVSIVRPTEIVITKADVLQKLGSVCYIENGDTNTCHNVSELLDILKMRFPIKYVSWSPMDGLEKV